MPLIQMIFDIAQVLLNVLWWIVFIHVVLSILISFNVINTYNEFVGGLFQGLERLCSPLYRPIRRILPDTRPLDLAPFVVLLLISITASIIIPRIAQTVATL